MQTFTVIVAVREKAGLGYMKYRNVSKISSLIKYIRGKGHHVVFANIYDTKSRQLIETIKHL